MSKQVFLLYFFIAVSHGLVAQKVIARQGQVAFFSYTPVENIKAENNQVLSIIDLSSGEVAVSMLMNAFIFEKALMREHFNESYVESDIYPQATFRGQIQQFENITNVPQSKIITGTFEMHGMSREIEVKAKMQKTDDKWVLTGNFDAVVSDYNIKIPPMLSGNIAKAVSVQFSFEFEPYEE